MGKAVKLIGELTMEVVWSIKNTTETRRALSPRFQPWVYTEKKRKMSQYPFLRSNPQSNLAMKTSSVLTGAVAGAAATVPMTLTLFGVAPFLPGVRAFPPRMAVRLVTGKAGLWQQLSARQRSRLSWAGHFGYGALMGGVYASAAGRYGGRGAGGGLAFGLAVWAGSYLGALPALGIRRPLRKSFRDDHVQLVVAHLVWGAALGWLEKRLRQGSRTPS